MDKDKTRNDIAWEKLFDKYSILEEIEKNRFFKIDSSQINDERQSRLMAKFDHYVNLPKIFKEHKLSILPISRSRYIIGRFKTHYDVSYDDIEPIICPFSDKIESIDYTDLYSETSMIHCAFLTEMIDNLVGEPTKYTVSGRMSTKELSFSIRSTVDDKPYPIDVENSQCEIDAGFESENYFLLIEAKNGKVDDFLIRQLYYPYRLWTSKISKKVIPILMTYSYDTFSFFMYEFADDLDYNSINLIEQRNYQIAPEIISLDDVSNVFNQINIVDEPDIPFPQANNFNRVIDLLALLVEKDLTLEEIAENYQFDVRQAQYYSSAGIYLGLINKYTDHYRNKVNFCLTAIAKKILRKRHKEKYLSFIYEILKYEVFYKVFQATIARGEVPSKEDVCIIMSNCGLPLGTNTIDRRASTVRGWINWIWSQIDRIDK